MTKNRLSVVERHALRLLVRWPSVLEHWLIVGSGLDRPAAEKMLAGLRRRKLVKVRQEGVGGPKFWSITALGKEVAA
jgi:hypothetical protein